MNLSLTNMLNECILLKNIKKKHRNIILKTYCSLLWCCINAVVQSTSNKIRKSNLFLCVESTVKSVREPFQFPEVGIYELFARSIFLYKK